MAHSRPLQTRLWSLIRRATLRYAYGVVIASVAISVPAAYYSAKLFGNLRPDLEELLPKQARSVTDLTEIRTR